jgi:drug/metabolite transporter (DMT)-like permease
LTIIQYRKEELKFPSYRADMILVIALSVAQIFMPNFLQNIGLEYTSASVSSVLQSTAPAFTLLLSFIFLREKAMWIQVGGVIIGLSGVALLLTGGNLGNLAGTQFVGNLQQLGVAAAYSVSGVIGKGLLRRHPPLLIVASTFLFGGGLLTLFAVVFERNMWPSTLSSEVVVALLLLSFMYCAGLVAWYDVLQRTGVFWLYVLLFLMPVLAVVISVIVPSETFSYEDILFSGLILVGVALTQWQRTHQA